MLKKIQLLKHFFTRPRRVALGAALVVLLLGLGFGWQFSSQYRAELLAEKRQTAMDQLTCLPSKVNGQI
ncbi:MAG: hypothetical protein HN736_10790 [Anaerolineae bacterium]|jgi:hypothetical protein|nr:hypothetical protein [Anaerolineae bacterium]MBT4457418.1 hypothetical protein [Anaerolineae bacterium]MBT6062543.1 hypothetical protein [Anaerolineae bacterium]MBT6323825.1 hypothetical protein [Anaerolineae bacterium]MBT6814552.1 hypothetical protein [Anaerolineae bacterium]